MIASDFIFFANHNFHNYFTLPLKTECQHKTEPEHWRLLQWPWSEITPTYRSMQKQIKEHNENQVRDNGQCRIQCQKLQDDVEAWTVHRGSGFYIVQMDTSSGIIPYKTNN